MADVSFHIDRGATAADLTFGTAQGTSDIELIIDNAEGVTKKDIILALNLFSQAVLQSELFDPLA